MPQKPPSFKRSLSYPNRTMAYLYSQIEQQQQILQRIQAVLPETLAKQTRHSLIKDQKLLIYTDSAVWASQLRFYKAAILAAIAPLTRTPVEHMQIKIITGLSGSAVGTKRKAHIPAVDKIELIRDHSLTVTDQQLSLALLKLSATLKRLSGAGQ